MGDTDSEFIRTHHAARTLGIGVRRVQLLLRSGKLPGSKLPHTRTWLIPREPFREIVARLKRAR